MKDTPKKAGSYWEAVQTREIVRHLETVVRELGQNLIRAQCRITVLEEKARK